MADKLAQLIANEAIDELVLFRETLAPLDRMAGLVVDILAAIRDGREVPDDLMEEGSEFQSALAKFDGERAKKALDRASLVIASHFGITS